MLFNSYADPDLHRGKRLLWLSVGVNLGTLGFFKHFNFFARSLAGALGTLGISVGS